MKGNNVRSHQSLRPAEIENLNHAALQIFRTSNSPGSQNFGFSWLSELQILRAFRTQSFMPSDLIPCDRQTLRAAT